MILPCIKLLALKKKTNGWKPLTKYLKPKLVEPTVGSTIEDEKELLRKTMSILGKRSAEKRRVRKNKVEGL